MDLLPVVDVADVDLPGLAGLRDHAGGVGVAALVDHLTGLDPASLDSDFDVLELIAAWDRVVNVVAAARVAAVAELASRPEVLGPDDDPRVRARRAVRAPGGTTTRTALPDEISARLAEGVGTSGSRCQVALQLPVRFPMMAAELRAGRASEVKVRILVSLCRPLDDDSAQTVDARVARLAGRQSPSRFRQSVRRAVLRLDPLGAHERRRRAEADRCVRISPSEDGMAELWALLPAVRATELGTHLENVARAAKAAGDERTLDQLRADALTEHLTSTVEVQVVVPASVLLGVGDDPAMLSGFGPVDAELARLVSRDATWRRILADPDDRTLLSAGTRTYRPGAVLQRHVALRDQTCRFPGCDRPAQRCDLDHTVPFDGRVGLTGDDNLGALCRRHHRVKHAGPPGDGGPPRLRQVVAGEFEWRLPTGHRHRVRPPELLSTDDPLLAAGTSARSRASSLVERGLAELLRAA